MIEFIRHNKKLLAGLFYGLMTLWGVWYIGVGIYGENGVLVYIGGVLGVVNIIMLIKTIRGNRINKNA